MSSEFSDRNQANNEMKRQDETAISELVWKSDEELEAQIRQEFSIIYNWTKNREDVNPVILKDIVKDLNDVKMWHRQYLESKPKNKEALDKAFNLITTARIKMDNANPVDIKKKEFWLTGLLGGSIYVLGGWLIARFLSGWLWPGLLFFVDLVFIAIVGAFASATIYLGKRASRVSGIELIAKLAASPLLSIVLVILLSELSIGVGLQSSPTSTPSEIGAFTLRDASDMTKLAFGFLFAFFSETTIELLKKVLPSGES